MQITKRTIKVGIINDINIIAANVSIILFATYDIDPGKKLSKLS